MKKILLFLAAICCMMGANAQQFTDANGIKYNVTSTENNTVEVIAKDPYMQDLYEGDIVIPATVTNEDVTYRVTGIGNGAFEECFELTSIALPSSLESIGNGAFYGCIGLTSITLPSSVRSIGNAAFSACISLSSISVEEGNTVYDSRNNCNAIIEKATNTLVAGCKNTVIPSSVTAIGKSAFSGYSNLTSITIPSSVTSIGELAFSYCTSLASVTIPSSVAEVGEGAFSSSGLASVTLPNGITSIEEDTFYRCENLTSVILPNCVTSIGHEAFSGCEKLTSVILPSSVTSIGLEAFRDCNGLTSITVLASTPPTLGEFAFWGVAKNIPVHVPDVEAYNGWGGFTNIQPFGIDYYKQAAIDEINAAKEGVALSAEEVTAINAYITTINNVTELSDDNLTIIENAKNNALAIISQAAIRTAREAALAAIAAAMQGETSAYLTGLAQEYIGIINAATDEAVINNARDAALAAINAAMGAYLAGKAEALGTMGTPCEDCPAVEVSDDNTTIILYNPKNVSFRKTNEANK